MRKLKDLLSFVLFAIVIVAVIVTIPVSLLVASILGFVLTTSLRLFVIWAGTRLQIT